MAVTYVRNATTGEFEQVGPGGATTDTTLSQAGKPADAAAVGNAIANVISVPVYTTSDNGKFLRVVSGIVTWATVESAEGVSF